MMSQGIRDLDRGSLPPLAQYPPYKDESEDEDDVD
jgi:hypothetical protein